MNKHGFTFFLFFFILKTACAQSESGFQWILPLQDTLFPIGIPSKDFIALRADKSDKKVYLLEINGKKDPVPYDSISWNNEKIWNSWKDGLRGVFHTEKDMIVPPVYDRIEAISKAENNWAYRINKYGMDAVVNNQNHLVLPYQKLSYARLSLIGDTILSYLPHDVFEPSSADYSYKSKNGVTVSDAVAKKQLPPAFQRISYNQYVISYTQKGKIRQDTFAAAEKFVKDIALVKRDSLWGYWRKNGSWVITPRFQAAQPFDEQGLAVAKQGGKYGVIKANGDFLVAPRFANLKPRLPGLFEFTENGKTGLVDSFGTVVLQPGVFTNFQTAGTQCFAAQSGDSLLVFQRNGNPLNLGKVTECSKTAYDQRFLIKIKVAGKDKSILGVWSADGKWCIPNILSGSVKEKKNFFIVETLADPCCEINGVNFGSNQKGKYLIFDRTGAPLLSFPVDNVVETNDDTFVIFKLKDKYGLVASLEQQIKPEYSNLKSLGNGWISAEKDGKIGILK